MPSSESSGRSTLVSILLAILFGGGIFVFCLGLMGPFALQALVVVGIVFGIGLCHYLLWGRSMEREVEAERAASAAAEEEDVPPETNGWPTDGPHGPRRF